MAGMWAPCMILPCGLRRSKEGIPTRLCGACVQVLYVNKPQMATMQNSVGEDGAEQQIAVRKNMGYCFVEFSSVGEAAAAVKAGEDGCVSLDGKQLKVTTKEAWANTKKKFREAQKKQGAAKSQMVGAAATTSNGLVLHFQGATGPLTWLQAREIFEAFAPVAHAEMRDAGEGERAEGYMRFESAKGARLCLAHVQDRKMRIGGSAISLRMREITAPASPSRYLAPLSWHWHPPPSPFPPPCRSPYSGAQTNPLLLSHALLSVGQRGESLSCAFCA